MLKYILLFITGIAAMPAAAQIGVQNPFGLSITSSAKAYQESFKKDPKKQLLEIKKVIPDIVLDIRYATRNNFMKQVMYPKAKAFARAPVVEQLKIIQKELRKKGYGLKIYDAYRPYAITRAFYEKASDKAR
jgi:D-alanyl-D-alanine dipeptidase